MKKALAIDVGGTKISYAIINEKGEILNDIVKISTPKTKEEIENKFREIIQEYENKVDAIAFATAGAVNKENTQVIGSTGNLAQGYKDIIFSKLSNKKIFVENDANCAAWAEHKIGASKGYNNSIMLTFGTGVGGGIIIENKLLKGKSGSAGEMHFKISRERKRKCTCGEYDCFEIYASGKGLEKTAREVFRRTDISTYDVVELDKKGNRNAHFALKIWQYDITNGIIALQNIFDTDCFVFSGSMGKFIEVEKMEEYVNKNIVTTPTKIFHGKAGNHSGMIGAALLALEK